MSSDFLITLATLLALLTIAMAQCPHRCFCNRNAVRCHGLRLTSIPRVPIETHTLDLRMNRIGRLTRGMFPNLPNLKVLLLNKNKVTGVDAGAFNGLPELEKVYLYENEITDVHRDAFRNIPHLEQLYLHNNKLSTLPEGLFERNQRLRRLRLENNELVCDCSLAWLATLLRQDITLRRYGAVQCKYPASLSGRLLQNIELQCDGSRATQSQLQAPRITVNPTSVNVRSWDTVTFQCQVEGNPTPSIVWMRNGHPIRLNSRITVLNDGSLRIQHVRDTDHGRYYCTARSALGQVRGETADLRFIPSNAIPRFSETPTDITVAQGADVSLPCRAEGIPRPGISWTQDGVSISSNIRASQQNDGSLFITNVRVSDAGLYECSASSSAQTISSQAQLRVMVAPLITRPPVDASVLQGSTANFSCEARGDSQPVITWTKDGQLLRNNGRYSLLQAGGMLRIQQVSASDQGRFTCRAENAAGSITSSAVLRIVENEIPVFAQSSEHISAVAGTEISLRCLASGKPTPLYDWKRDGRVLQNRNRFNIQAGVMVISDVQLIDAGRYDCVAENVIGEATKSIFLQVHGSNTARPGDRFVNNAVPEANSRVRVAINRTLTQLFDRSRTHSVSDLLTAFRYPSGGALGLAQAEEIFEQTLEIIHQHVNEGHNYELDGEGTSYQELVSPAHLHLIANMSGCLQHTHEVECSNSCFHRRYRTMDGTCNNLKNPTWGAANTAFTRLLPAIYENGFNQPVGWNSHKVYSGSHLPSPRLISKLLMSSPDRTDDDKFTHMLMQWGQFVDHDMDLAPQAISYARFSDGRNCNETCENTSPCFPIPLPRTEVLETGRHCHGFTRTSATCNSGSTSLFFNTVSPRQQLNALSAFIDASNVYGNSDEMARRLRDSSNDRGLLREGPVSSGNKRLLPYDDNTFGDTLDHIDCQIEPSKTHVPCFRAGDPRANEQLALTAMHTLWMRQHNHIARQLRRMNPHWHGEKIYQEGRKIVGALMQHITYTSWIPKILGPNGMEIIGNYRGYQADVNPSIVNEFAVAALRFGHTLVQPLLFRLNETFHETSEGNLHLHQAFFAPYRLLEEGGIDPLLRGLFGRAAKKRMPGEFFNTELTEKLFKLANAIGQDLASLNIQRGRDHAIQFYNDYREYCGLHRASTFEDLSNEIQHRETRLNLQNLYGHPDNIDLFIGGLSETLVEGAKVGKTFRCILADQFKRLRDGDRFWYERDSIFTEDQLVAIKRTTLSSVLCSSSDGITRVQEDVFLRVDDDSDYKDCSEIPTLDLSLWTDCCEDCRTRATLASFAARSRGRRSAEYSYPHEKPMVQNQSSADDSSDEPEVDADYDSEDQDEVKSSTTAAANNITQMIVDDKAAVLESKITEIDQRQLDDTELVDIRVEGLEEMISELHKQVLRLTKKMKVIESVRRRSCRDKRRKLRQHGERWRPDQCTTCWCERGQVECRSKNCTQGK